MLDLGLELLIKKSQYGGTNASFDIATFKELAQL